MISQLRVLILGLIFCLPWVTTQSVAEKVSAEKFRDFYRHKKEDEQRERTRESSQLKYKSMREKQEKKHEKLAIEYAKKNSRQKQELRDQKADVWMAKQDKIHEDNLESARKRYIEKKKNNYKYKIPESEEYEVK